MQVPQEKQRSASALRLRGRQAQLHLGLVGHALGRRSARRPGPRAGGW
jgi:hypothetical protein